MTKKAYRISRSGVVVKQINYETLADITFSERGSRDGKINIVNQVGGGRHRMDSVSGNFYLLEGDCGWGFCVRENELIRKYR